MSATYLVDVSADLASQLLKQERTPGNPYSHFRGEWKLVELVEVRKDPAMQGGSIERWKIYDSEADAEFEGKLVEPSLRQEYDEETQVMTSYVSGRKILDVK